MLLKNRDAIIRNGVNNDFKKMRGDLLEILESALNAVEPYKAVKKIFHDDVIKIDGDSINVSDFENVFVVGFGKASVGMTQAFCDSVDVEKGVCVTNDPVNKVTCENVTTYVASHPIPDEKSIRAAEKVVDMVECCQKDDVLFVLISGGGSALLCKPRIDLADMQLATDLLLKCGADINEINTIRKHLSFVKGGQLVKNVKCRVVSLVISDIIGDPLEFIASGPTSPDTTSFVDAEKILKKYDLWESVPDDVRKIIDSGVKGLNAETPKPDDPVFEHVTNFVIANNSLACKRAVDKADFLGYKTMLLTASLNGDAVEMGRYLIQRVKAYQKQKDEEAVVFVAGGETTVLVKGSGQGGRNQEMVLGCIDQLDSENIVFASFATDGRDGKSVAAGAIADGNSKKRAKDKQLDISCFLENNDSYNFFRLLDDLIVTGPTGTNVMDIQVIIKKW